MRRTQGLLVVLMLSLALGACGANMAPVLEVRDENALRAPDASTMYEVVRWALDAKGWRVEDERPGALLATVTAGGHWGTVEIVYDDLGYAIRHVRSSPGLKFDGVYIHKRFNLWVDRLDNAIQNRLRAVGAKG